MTECFELRPSIVAVPTPQGVATSPISLPCLIDGAEDFVEVLLQIHVLRLFSDMTPDERLKYNGARAAKTEEIQRAKAARAGITLATEIPRGGNYNGGFKPPTS